MKNYDATQGLKEMIDSCFTYGGIEKESYNYSRYILPYKDKLGAKVFEQIYKEEAERLNQYKVIQGTYTDCDGLTYNSLEKIN
jgi:hypothetical protein